MNLKRHNKKSRLGGDATAALCASYTAFAVRMDAYVYMCLLL